MRILRRLLPSRTDYQRCPTKLRLESLEGRRLMTTLGDFNGDGYDDLVVGSPFEDLGSVLGDPDVDAGAVNVIYGSQTGLTSDGNQFLHQNNDASAFTGAEQNDLFGAAFAVGDFNNDNYDDLAVGIPGENRCGAVQVYYGSKDGLSSWRVKYRAPVSPLSQNRFGNDVCEDGDAFGTALAAGDFDGDGADDLAVSAPLEVHASGAIGIIHVFSNRFTREQTFVPGSGGFDIEFTSDVVGFGYTLATGNFDGDKYDDLVIGSPFDTTELAGVVHVLPGSGVGLANSDYVTLNAGTDATAGDRFGIALATGNFDGDQSDDLAIAGDRTDDTNVYVFDGSTRGMATTPDLVIEDISGSSLAAGKFDGDRYEDLAVGIPFAEVDGSTAAGRVAVYYGSHRGIDPASYQTLDQNAPDVKDYADNQELFGWSLAAADFNGDDTADLAVGVPHFPSDPTITKCLVQVFYGERTAGLNGYGSEDDQIWNQDTPGIRDSFESTDYTEGHVSGFGVTLGAPSVDLIDFIFYYV